MFRIPDIADKFDLGIVWKDGKIINHRSLLKVLVKPLLRRVGLCIGTMYFPATETLGGPHLMWNKPSDDIPPLKFVFKVDWDYDKIERRRIFI